MLSFPPDKNVFLFTSRGYNKKLTRRSICITLIYEIKDIYKKSKCLFGKEGGAKWDTCFKVAMMFVLVTRTFSRMKHKRSYAISSNHFSITKDQTGLKRDAYMCMHANSFLFAVPGCRFLYYQF